jgi:hypothetical protein
VVVEPDLAKGNGFVSGEVRLQPAHRRVEVAGVFGGLMGMNADRESHPVPGRSDRPRALPFPIVTGRQDHQRAGQPGVACARYDGVEVGSELLAGEMAVRVNHYLVSVGPHPHALPALASLAPMIRSIWLLG